MMWSKTIELIHDYQEYDFSWFMHYETTSDQRNELSVSLPFWETREFEPLGSNPSRVKAMILKFIAVIS